MNEVQRDQVQAEARLAERARPLRVTFHRAFDVCRDPMAAIEDLVEGKKASTGWRGGGIRFAGGSDMQAFVSMGITTRQCKIQFSVDSRARPSSTSPPPARGEAEEGARHS